MQDLAKKFENLTIQSDFIFKKVMSRQAHLHPSVGGITAD